MCFAQDAAVSNTYASVVVGELQFLGQRLDAIYEATNKGSHTTLRLEEARRYVLHTYLLVADLLSLKSDLKPLTAD
jgi:hypothetical protein